jgi:D-amino-acid dehydrogenase
MSKNLHVGIVGAGIQGISNALFLQKKGFEVTIFDRDNPGSPAASYGNAGHFSPYASLSLNRTDMELCAKNVALVFQIYFKYN